MKYQPRNNRLSAIRTKPEKEELRVWERRIENS